MCNGESIYGSIQRVNFVCHASINSLMDPYVKWWNELVVSQVFSDNITVKILNTLLFDHGHYSVRSAYRLCVSELIDLSHLRRPGYWSEIWRLKVPPKVKNLVWRMCRSCLPTWVTLHDKGFNVQLTMLIVIPAKKTLPIFFLLVLLRVKYEQGPIYGLIKICCCYCSYDR